MDLLIITVLMVLFGWLLWGLIGLFGPYKSWMHFAAPVLAVLATFKRAYHALREWYSGR